MEDMLKKVTSLVGDYPDLFILLLGGLIGYVLTLMLERYFLPIVQDPEAKRHQKGATFIFCWIVSGTASVLLWGALDPAKPLYARVVIGYLVNALTFLVYPVLARMATNKWPAIGTAWSKDCPPDDGQNCGA